MIHTLGNVLGGIGVVCFLVAFFMLQRDSWKHNSVIYLVVNLVGAILIVISLLIDWNLPAFVLEALWGLISIWGLVKLYKARSK